MYATKFNNELTPWITNDFIKFNDYFLRNNDYLPPLTIIENKDDYSIKLIFSGSCKWMFRVYWEDDLVVICGQRENTNKDKPKPPIKVIQAFKRIIVIPKNLEKTEEIHYQFTNCSLSFKLYKKLK
ncbi:Hsp20 family protein [uncultured Tenacibaculum sp.]|uniref:Hsp20 family protein n=1 Tax=uncultured Tenacibaculum sp. TaxID=174713 RepID=UPI002615EA22|nr:Hsp20 family protein [uncultured Tenacibaculum sp.]